MKEKQKYCKTCLTKLRPDNYCVTCDYELSENRPGSMIDKNDIPRAYLWYGLIATLVFGFASYFIVYSLFGGDYTMKKMGASLFFIVPLCSGATLGYFIRPDLNILWCIFLSMVAASALALLIFEANLAGLACTTILAGLYMIPLYCGQLFGRVIRRWSVQHLTAQFQSSPLAIFFFIPIFYGAIEEQLFEPTPIRTVETQMIIKAPPSTVWKTVRFYEHVKQDPPLILKLGLPIPKRAIGNHKKVGEITSCEYEGGGFIRKKITRLVEQQELSFNVIEQSIHFEHDLKLHGGSILLTPTNNGKHTIITMKTQYDSYVRPSWLWEPSMDYVIKTLHRHVMKDMQNELGGYALKSV